METWKIASNWPLTISETKRQNGRPVVATILSESGALQRGFLFYAIRIAVFTAAIRITHKPRPEQQAPLGPTDEFIFGGPNLFRNSIYWAIGHTHFSNKFRQIAHGTGNSLKILVTMVSLDFSSASAS
jgi:hypothetical protein